jgi:hypothetical protein
MLGVGEGDELVAAANLEVKDPVLLTAAFHPGLELPSM